MAIKEILIDRFNSTAENKRNLPNGLFRYLENLEIDDDNSAKQVINTTTVDNDQCIVKLLRYGNIIYGIGWDATETKDVQLYSYESGVYTALTTSKVTGTMSNLDSLFSIMDGVVYFDGGNSYISKYVLSTNTLTAQWKASTGGGNGGVVWKGSLYAWNNTNNDIRKIDGTTPDWASMIVISKTQTIKQLIPYGNYLAIVCSASSISDDGISRMYIWDGVTTTTFAEIVEIGTGVVSGANLLDGIITAVVGFPNKKGFRIKQYSGSIFQTVYTYNGRRNLTSSYLYCIPCSLVKSYTGNIYFMISGARPGSSHEYSPGYEVVIFRYGRQNINENYKLLAYKDLQVLAGTSYAVGVAGGNDFIVYEYETYTDTPNNVIYAVVLEASYKTRQVYSTASTFSGQAGVIETGIYSGNDCSVEKKLLGINLQTAPLPAAGQVIVKYKKDAETSWTTLATITTNNNISYTIRNIESTGANLPIFNEISFRIELTGAAELTQFKFKYEELTNVYGN